MRSLLVFVVGLDLFVVVLPATFEDVFDFLVEQHLFVTAHFLVHVRLLLSIATLLLVFELLLSDFVRNESMGRQNEKCKIASVN